MAEVQLRNALLHRKSFVTDSSLHATEPHTAAPIILSHESLWIDSELIPDQVPPLASQGGVDTANNNQFFDSSGLVVAHATVHGRRVSAVQKRVRIELTRGDFGEYTSTEDLRRVIHPNYASGYAAVVEYAPSDAPDALAVLPSHLWQVQHMAGVVVLTNKSLQGTIAPSLYLTAYLYCGRVGLDSSIKDATTDDIEEGVVNRFFTKELLLTHMLEFATDSADGPNFVLSVASSDALTEGVHHKFFTQENFDTAFGAKSLRDLGASETTRFVTAETMSRLDLSLGGVSELGFNVAAIPPQQTSAKLYVERATTGENVLYFEDTPLGSAPGPPPASTAGPHAQAESLGNFTGYFTGPTSGVHTGDVKGNVQGFVSDLGNHPIIEAKVLGNGEGHWVGTVNGDVVGKFEGHAKIVTGSVDNASHVTVGTFDSTASVHVKSKDSHIQISNTDGGSSMIECQSESRVAVSCSSFRTTSIICDNVNCSHTLTVSDLNTNNLRCAGLTNSFYGIFEAGRIEDVSEILAETASLSVCKCDALDAHRISGVDSVFGTTAVGDGHFATISCNNSTFHDVKSDRLSVSLFHVEHLSFDASVFLDNSRVVFDTLSVATTTLDGVSAGSVVSQDLEVRASATIRTLVSESTRCDRLAAGALSVSELHLADGLSLDVPTLSAHTLLAFSERVGALSANTLVCAECTSATTRTTSLEALTASANGILADSLSASSVDCVSLSAATVGSDRVHFADGSAARLSCSDLTAEGVRFVALSCATVHSQGVVASTTESALVDTHQCNVTHLSAQSTLSHTVACDDHTSGRLSASHSTFETTHTLSLASRYADVAELTSDVHSCTHLSAGSSDFASLRTQTLSVHRLDADHLRSASTSTGSSTVDVAVVQRTLSCGEALSALEITTPTLHAQRATSDAVAAASLSTHALVSELSRLRDLSASAAFLDNAATLAMSCSALRCDDIVSPRASFAILSVNSIVGFSIDVSVGGVSQEFVESLFLSINESIDSALDAASIQGMVDDALNALPPRDQLETLSCSDATVHTLVSDSVRAARLQGDSLSVSELVVSSLSVGSLHGVVITQELSVSGLVGHISTASVTTSDLSCGTLFVDNIVRPVPHISDTATPAVLTTSTVGDFQLFSEDAKHSGDMVIEGSLYVTDTIFMGREPALNIENVQNIVASRMSVGELAVGMLTGIGGDLDISNVVTNVLSASADDTFHRGNMQIDGNLVVSGVVLTGSHNRLMDNHGSFEMQGTLSVSGAVIANGVDLVETLASLQSQLDLLRAQ